MALMLSVLRLMLTLRFCIQGLDTDCWLGFVGSGVSPDYIICTELAHNYCILKQFSALDKGGRLFLLMGDWKQKGKLYSMLSDCAKPGTLEQIIIKLQHNCMSDSSTYSNRNFVQIIHEYLVVLRKDEPMLIPVTTTVKRMLDMRDSKNSTWRDTLLAVLQHYVKEMSLQELYEELAPHRKAKANPHWKDKVRQTVQDARYFKRTSRGCYTAA